ncbi:MAG TPA: hypothetical protein VFE05_22365 [Longimicrobiaceae bacterium]|jgi:hypothetical protein|nr:hypothetical protein [Longimicrobiaceae bacterium]
MNKPTPRTARRALALAGFALLAACSDATAPVRTGELPANLERGIYPLISVASQTKSAAQVELYLKRVQVSPSLASFQGELTYDPRIMTLDHTDLPPGIIGATNEVSPGHVRFAGASIDGVGDVPVLELRFTTHGELSRGAFGVKVEEVVGAGDLANLTSAVSTGEPFFSTSGR